MRILFIVIALSGVFITGYTFNDHYLGNHEVAKHTSTSFDHTIWDQLLQKYVTASGKVNYQGFKGEESKLDAYLDALSAQVPTTKWSRNEQMAYWINAYNAFTVKLILDNYPVASIMDTHGGKAWDVSWIKLGNKTYTLNQIEHEILRPTFKDARIHFAVNCAAKSCPPLLNKAWQAATLDQNLTKQTKRFINNPKYTTLTKGEIKISKIFEWYAEDFGDISAYIQQYADVAINDEASVVFLDYDWALNQ